MELAKTWKLRKDFEDVVKASMVSANLVIVLARARVVVFIRTGE
jgi:hypothetical protein